MRTIQQKKIIHEGNYMAEVLIELIDTEEGWSPYISLDDANKLEKVKKALKNKDIKTASESAKVFSLKSVAV